jgi:hypothetical protein
MKGAPPRLKPIVSGTKNVEKLRPDVSAGWKKARESVEKPRPDVSAGLQKARDGTSARLRKSKGYGQKVKYESKSAPNASATHYARKTT